MAKVNLDWDSVDFEADSVTGWISFKNAVTLEKHQTLLSNRAVYVIRIMRPYAFSYGKKYSPVAYIGKGQAQQRLTSHLKSWIPRLGKTIGSLNIKIFFCEPRARKLGTICEHVEADLIHHFQNSYGDLPLRKLVKPSQLGEHTYDAAQLRVLHPDKGPGYHWAIRPLPSSHFYKV